MAYERDIENDNGTEKLDIGLLKFFWQTNPLFKSNKSFIPRFLKNLVIFKNFSDYELWELSKNLHKRTFSKGEVIFKESDNGVGFYFIVKGSVDIVIEKDHSTDQTGEGDFNSKVVVTLEKNDYFGELALLQDRHQRNASAVAREQCQLLGIFKPDLDIMIHEKPVVASKLLQSISLIVANRLYSVTREVRRLKEKIKNLEKK